MLSQPAILLFPQGSSPESIGKGVRNVLATAVISPTCFPNPRARPRSKSLCSSHDILMRLGNLVQEVRVLNLVNESRINTWMEEMWY